MGRGEAGVSRWQEVLYACVRWGWGLGYESQSVARIKGLDAVLIDVVSGS